MSIWENQQEENHGALANDSWVTHSDGVSIAQGDDFQKILTWQLLMHKVVEQINDDIDKEKVTSGPLIIEATVEEDNSFKEGGVWGLKDTGIVEELLNTLVISRLLKEQ